MGVGASTPFVVGGSSADQIPVSAGGSPLIKLSKVLTAADSSFVVPAGYRIDSISVVNTTANAITGGLKFGTTNGAVDIVLALAVAANGLLSVLDSLLLKRIFSLTVPQTLFIDAVVAWNNASVNITIYLLPL